MNNIKQAISEIKLVGFDIDGVMSDGGLIFSDSNVDFESKIFNVKDGFAIKLLQKSNIEIVIITGRKSSCVENRIIKSLGIKKDFLFQYRERSDCSFDIIPFIRVKKLHN